VVGSDLATVSRDDAGPPCGVAVEAVMRWMMCGPHYHLNPFELFQKISNPIQTRSNFIRSKKDISELEKIGLKYGCEGFNIRNNFPYSNFSIFRMNFEIKLRLLSKF
jgi:hypothetical protein